MKTRLIEHTDRIESKDYVSTTRAAYLDLSLDSGEQRVGRRTELLEKAFRQKVDQEMRAKEEEFELGKKLGYYETSHKSGLPRHPRQCYAVDKTASKKLLTNLLPSQS